MRNESLDVVVEAWRVACEEAARLLEEALARTDVVTATRSSHCDA